MNPFRHMSYGCESALDRWFGGSTVREGKSEWLVGLLFPEVPTRMYAMPWLRLGCAVCHTRLDHMIQGGSEAFDSSACLGETRQIKQLDDVSN
jgi:hypothetical protein